MVRLNRLEPIQLPLFCNWRLKNLVSVQMEVLLMSKLFLKLSLKLFSLFCQIPEDSLSPCCSSSHNPVILKRHACCSQRVSAGEGTGATLPPPAGELSGLPWSVRTGWPSSLLAAVNLALCTLLCESSVCLCARDLESESPPFGTAGGHWIATILMPLCASVLSGSLRGLWRASHQHVGPLTTVGPVE